MSYPTYKLGKLPLNPRKLKLVPHLASAVDLLAIDWDELPETVSCIVPGTEDWGNKDYGCCTCAGVFNGFKAIANRLGIPFNLTRADCLGLYSRVTGFNPETGANDNGAECIDVLNEVRKNGLTGDGNWKLLAFSQFDGTNPMLARWATWATYGGYIGMSMPVCFQTQPVWKIPDTGTADGPGLAASWGDHALWEEGDDLVGPTYKTWGEDQKAQHQIRAPYVDEQYVLFPEFLKGVPGWKSPAGLDLDTLIACMAGLDAVRAG